MTSLTKAEACLKRRELDEAARCFHQAIQDSPEPDRIDAGLWQLHMLMGEFEQAWQASDRIRSRKHPDPNRLWMDESIDGKNLVIRSLHGFGDAVQMFQYASSLKARAHRVTWQLPPKLLPLAGSFRDVEHIITWEEPCEWDVQLEITELPYIFRTALPHLPLATKYLNVSKKLEMASKPRVGIVWRAGEWNPGRSLPLSALNVILEDSSFEFVSLQGGSYAEQHPRLSPLPDGLVLLAQTIARLDLVITVDTLAAHLAGSLGIPAYVLLEHAADWRWMTGREDSPWYPSLRLFRQPTPGDWTSPLQSVHKELGRLTV